MKFDERLKLVPSESCNLSVAVINAQSLHCHMKDVKNHSSTQSSHIIGVTETFLMPIDAQCPKYSENTELQHLQKRQI